MKEAISVDPIFLVKFAAIEEAKIETGKVLRSRDSAPYKNSLFRILVTLETYAWAGNPMLETTKGGYLRATKNGKYVYIPFHLVEHFPFAETLDELIEFSESLAISGNGYICVSGSTAILKRVGAVGDIDFCEYLEKFDAQEAERLGNILAEFEKFVCTRIKWGEIFEDKRPWPLDFKSTFAESIVREPQLATLNIKIDSVTITPSFGAIAVTNMALPQGRSLNHPTIDSRSWVFQEAIFANSEMADLSLVEPEVFGRYLIWLRNEIANYLDKNPLKAAKRALSLSLILSFRDEEALLALALQQPILVVGVRNAAFAEASRIASFSGTELPKSIADALIKHGSFVTQVNQDEVNDATKFCQEAAGLVLGRYDKLLDEAQLIVAEEFSFEQ